ncbi:MAG: lipid-A-disaccharide synthase [Candidatus Hydrogenedentes bacterium]|nr:lipid-A-disaccharide synthase [Candidatus Hydrogenedentota bacterium]
MKRIFFVAGESSGDIHGANLIRALREMAPDVQCEGLGGTHMAAAGMDLRYDLAEHAIMGFTEILRSFGMIRRIFRETRARLEASRPDAVVLIDYPGFNLRLAREAHKLEIPIIYYISPQVWAWKRKRVRTIARLVRKMLVILPFEAALYEEAGVDSVYVGHPLLDHIPTVNVNGALRDKFVVGLLPGSRRQEIERLLPVMLDVARDIRQRHPEAYFVSPCVDAEREKQIRSVAADFPLHTQVGKTYEVLDAARFCMVASGTATVETALFGVPFVILYRVTNLTYWIARALVRVHHIGMVNILANKRVVPEFVQHEATRQRIVPVVFDLLEDTPARRQMIEDLAAVRAMLGTRGASQRAAGEILDVLSEKSNG